MDLKLQYTGMLLLEDWKTTNKVHEDDEVRTGYAKFKGLVPASMFGVLTGMEDIEYRNFYWANDGQIRHPTMGAIPFNAVAEGHIVEFHSNLKYRDEDATIRGFKLAPAYGHQWMATFDILIRPTTDAVIGRFAAKEGHDVDISVAGPREGDLLTGKVDD